MFQKTQTTAIRSDESGWRESDLVGHLRVDSLYMLLTNFLYINKREREREKKARARRYSSRPAVVSLYLSPPLSSLLYLFRPSPVRSSSRIRFRDWGSTWTATTQTTPTVNRASVQVSTFLASPAFLSPAASAPQRVRARKSAPVAGNDPTVFLAKYTFPLLTARETVFLFVNQLSSS